MRDLLDLTCLTLRYMAVWLFILAAAPVVVAIVLAASVAEAFRYLRERR